MLVSSTPSRTAAFGVAALAVLALAGCAPEPAATPAPTGSTPPASATATTPTPSATSPTPTTTADADGDLTALPTCEEIYSPGMLATLNAESPPLNDPGVTLFSTQNAVALEVLNSGAETVRCSWGTPSESGLATNVTIVDATQAAAVQEALTGDGFGCTASGATTFCTFEKETVDLDDNLVRTGESHIFHANGWVSTAFIDYFPAGYSEDIAATLWG